MMPMVHDNIIKAYSVDFEAETLSLRTLYQTDRVIEKTNVVFSGYLVHDFDLVMKDSIIFDIFENDPHTFLERDGALLKENKSHGWPIFYEDESELVSFLQAHCYKIFYIYSTLGLSGFVLARQMEIIVGGDKAT